MRLRLSLVLSGLSLLLARLGFRLSSPRLCQVRRPFDFARLLFASLLCRAVCGERSRVMFRSSVAASQSLTLV
jgi:hypothetical protein